MNKSLLEQSKLLLVEDEDTLAIGLEYNLQDEGYIVERAKDGKQAIDLIKNNKYDLIILDIMLPYFDGFEIAKIVRRDSPQMPILILTARTSNEDKVRGLELGADDYLTKPFNLKELLLRIKGMLKRKNWYEQVVELSPVFNFGNNTVNFETFKCTNGDKEFMLTQLEAVLLKYLVDNKGKILSRKDLLENVWQINAEIETRRIDNFISRLRKYFEPDPENPIYIKGVRSAGYTFDSSQIL